MAAVTAGVVALGATAYSANRQSAAAGDAADAQSRQAGLSLGETQRQYDQTRHDLAPYRESGGLALDRQQAFMGLHGVDAQNDAYNSFQESPGTQFLRDQGMRGLSSSQALRGTGGGDQLRELSRFNQGLALQDFGNFYNRLGGLSSQGLSAATQGASLGGQNVAQQNQIRNQQGAATASGILGQEEARSRGINSGLQILGGMMGGVGGAPQPRAANDQGLTMVTDPNQFAGYS